MEHKEFPTELRKRAEQLLRPLESTMDPLSVEDMQRLLHELHVHQFELEIQNEELRRAQDELAAARDRYVDLYDFAPNGYVTIGNDGLIQQANLTAGILFGVERGLLPQTPLRRWVAIDSEQRYYQHRKQVLAAQGRCTCELKLLRKDKSEFFAQLNSVAIEDEAGRYTRWHTSITDISERKRAEQALAEEKERIQTTLHSIAEAVITTDPAGRVDYMNPVAEALTGWGLEQARGRPLGRVFQVIDTARDEPVPDAVAHVLERGFVTGLTQNATLIGRSGQPRDVKDSARLMRRPDGKVLGVVLVFQDVTEERRLAQEVAYQASHDALTGLVNRREFEQRLERVLNTVQVDHTQHALCYLDLDQFKIINDACGHWAGDDLLRQVARLLQAHVRKRDTLARLGGDEFGILLEHCSLEQATRVANALREALEGFWFGNEGKRFNIGVSIGLVPITAASKHMTEVLRAADSACYAAKEAGRNRVHLYSSTDAELAQRHGEMQWVSRIPRALEENRFCLAFQDIMQTKAPPGRAHDHYELLLRLHDEAGQIVLPNAFLPAAERYRLTPKIDRWVIATALTYLAAHPDELAGLMLCAINISGHSCADPAFLEFVLRQLNDTAVPAAKVCFEITETAAIEHLADARRFITVLKQQGCRFALDDFGSGLSSFAYLKQLPVDFLKIDGTFVTGIVDNAVDLAMVRAIHEIARVLGIQTIAEFAETSAILDKLRELEVDYVQGYAIGQPQPLV
jgi:diguanylate cyclase (GGDEF)-like protein/PAS domain S-box-containing protein